MSNQLKKFGFLLILMLIVGSVGVSLGFMQSNLNSNARATLVSPRFGNTIQGPFSAGPNLNTTNYLDRTIMVWVAPDPVETLIPSSWKTLENWDVVLLPSVLRTANCTPLNVIRILTGTNTMVLFGGGMDVNPLYPTAIGLECSIPADISPALYDLIVGFKTLITPEIQHAGSIDLIPHVGDWQGPVGSASESLLGDSPAFLLKDCGVVSIPWLFDAKTSDSSEKVTNDGNPVNSFTLIHVTDTHINSIREDISEQTGLWKNDCSVLSPDVIVLSGDLMDNPGERIQDYDLAYNELRSLNLPIILTDGNHDQFQLGPWRHYFGSVYSTTQYDDLSIIKFDSTMPLGTGILNWLSDQTISARNKGPVLLTCHYPLVGSYFTSGWQAVCNMMIEQNVDAILVGHTHTDFNAEIATLQTLTSLDFEYATVAVDFDQPIENSQMIVTRSAGKTSDVFFQEELFPDMNESYSGYRKLTYTNNQISNYTYDYDGDGHRDPFLSIPNGRFSQIYYEDINLGTDLNAGMEWQLTSNMTETIPAARAIFELPAPPMGYHWALSAQNQTAGAYIRSMISDGMNYWIDARITAPTLTTISLRIEPQLGGF